MLILEKVPEKKIWGKKWNWEYWRRCKWLFFLALNGSISLGRGGQKHLEKWSSAFSCTATAVCHFAKAKAPTPQGIHHPSQRGSKRNATWLSVPFLLFRYPCCTLQWKHRFVFQSRGWTCIHSHHPAIAWADENNEPWTRGRHRMWLC